MQRQILHLDMDTFFVSVERLRDPALRGAPVVVGSDNPMARGVVAAASYEARAFGVHSGQALRQAYRLCPQARFVRPAPEAYAEASRCIREICVEVAPVVEMASVDEAYLDLSGTERLYGYVGRVADTLQRRIASQLGLPASFGWGENKLLAKVASGRSKPHGLVRVYPGRGGAFLAPLALRRLPGIGPKNAALLGRYGLERIGQLERLGERRLYEALGEVGRVIYQRSRGEDATPVLESRPAQSIGRERTFETDTGSRSLLLATLSLLSERIASALRRSDLRARRVTLKLRYGDFKTVTRTTTLAAGTDEDRALYRTAREALDRAWARRVRVRLIGIGVSDLTSHAWATLDLFEGEGAERLERLGASLERIRERYGFRAVLRARSMADVEADDPTERVF